MVHGAVDDVPHLSPEVHGQIGGVGHQHDLLPRVPTDEPCRVVCRHELALAVAWWDVDAHPVLVTLFNRHQLVCKQSVVSPNLIVGVHALAEGDQIVSRSLQLGPLVELFYHLLDFKDLVIGQSVEVLQEQIEFLSVE